MRTDCGPIDTVQLPWQQLSDVLSCKILNGSRENGAYTMILKSEPREPGPQRGQYHPADEEFLCLDGDFTFDGSTWFRGGSYAFYPAFFVHGTKVHVRGGYEVYLRISDTSALFFEDNPKSDEPYPISGHCTDDHYLQLQSAAGIDSAQNPSACDSLSATPLHARATNGQGSTLLHFAELQRYEVITLETADLLEIFAIDGHFSVIGGGELTRQSYMCRTGKSSAISLQYLSAGQLMISHAGNLEISCHENGPSCSV